METTKLNLWRNTQSVLEWYNSIDTKNQLDFIVFDIVEFYPSITQEMMEKALDFAENFTSISAEEKHIILHVERYILVSKDKKMV